jgi:type IV secretory pathway TraG/TraD family ATPase VirD4
MTEAQKRPNDGMFPLIALLSVVGVALLAWWPIVLIAHRHGERVPANPTALVVGLARHTVAWPGRAVLVLYGLQLLVVAIAAVLLLRARHRRARGRTRADRATRHLSRPSEMVGLTPSQVRQSSRRLRPGVAGDDPDQHGVLLVETLLSRTPLRMSWEDIAVVIAGPRVGKTTSNVVPAIVAYTGPVKTSSNKPDTHDATREIREDRGQVWLCDPQDLVGAGNRTAGPAFWWNPLADVTDLAVARELVQIMIDTTVDAEAKPDAYFHPTGKATLVNYVFAAALGNKTLLDVDAWLSDVQDTEACTILTQRGFAAAAAQIKAVLAKPDRQRDGVLGTAQSWLSVITDPRYAAWITPPAGTAFYPTPRFEPATFVRSAADTIYLLSQEGPASAAFVTTALNAAIDRAAIAYARTLAGKRLTNPVLSILDEAANTIRDTTLPDKASHYGSRGLPTVIVLQSWSQGVEVWGERGMRKLWSAANVKAYLGGVAETEFLKSMSDLLGDRDERYWTQSSNRSGSWGSGTSSTSTAEQLRRVPIMSVAELAALPRGRALVFSSGNRPALGRPTPWMSGPYAEQISASLAKWESEDDRDQRVAETEAASAEARLAELNDHILRDERLASSMKSEGVRL